MSIRPVKQLSPAVPTMEGAGVKLHRAFGFTDPTLADPFLLFDDFRNDRPEDYLAGFPWHPHRGIETITYVLAGTVDHGDSLGNQGTLGAGDVQWMTAGSGIMHQEMPKGDAAGRMHGFQLWANLPASDKMMDPRYREVKSIDIPEVVLDNGVRIRIICGKVDGVQGPVQDIVTDPEYLDVTIPAGMTFSHPTIEGYTVFAYVIGGKGNFDQGCDPYAFEVEGAKYFDLEVECSIGPENLVMFGDGDSISVSAEDEGVRFLLVSGRPIGEPVAWYGPIVMNTQKELKIAFDEYNKGTFIKHPK